jgi:hypothetical protein
VGRAVSPAAAAGVRRQGRSDAEDEVPVRGGQAGYLVRRPGEEPVRPGAPRHLVAGAVVEYGLGGTAVKQEVILAGRLGGLSPLGVLSRGYSLTRRLDDLSVVCGTGQVAAGDRLVTQVARGRIISRVEGVAPDPTQEEAP